MIGRRRFSTLEAWVYARFVEDGVAAAVGGAIRDAIGDAGRVLDVGCGSGVLARRLGALGVDAAPVSARRARGVAASASALPFPDASFDAVVSSCSIKHWPDPVAGVAECRRVLQAGGGLVVVELDRDGTREEVRRFVAGTRVPRAFRWLHTAVDLRSVLPQSPTAEELTSWVGAPARALDGLPYLIAVAR